MNREELIIEIERELSRVRHSDAAQERDAELQAALRDLNQRVFGPDLQAFLAQRTRRPSADR
jgi:hypothetical protein